MKTPDYFYVSLYKSGNFVGFLSTYRNSKKSGKIEALTSFSEGQALVFPSKKATKISNEIMNFFPEVEANPRKT